MSRTRTLGRRRRARQQELVEELTRARLDSKEFERAVRRLAASSAKVWSIAEASGGIRPLTFDERAIIAQIVAPPLAGSTAETAETRLGRAKE